MQHGVPMDLLKVLIVFAFALVILNMLTNGYVWQKLTSYNSEALSKGVACAIGLYFLPPLKHIGGFWIPIPDASDLIIGAFLTIVIYTFLKEHVDFNFPLIILLYVTILGLMKLAAFAITMYAGAECFYIAKTGSVLFEPLFWVSLIVGLPALIWFLIKIKLES